MNLTDIRQFAINAHGDQQYGAHPYSVHLDAVAALARQFGDVATAIAYLHDVVEDTEVTVVDLRDRFGDLIADCVAILSDEPGANRQARKALTYAKMKRVRGEQELALIVKAADRLANVRSCVKNDNTRLFEVYRGEHPTFKEAAYRPGAAEAIWEELHQLIG